MLRHRRQGYQFHGPRLLLEIESISSSSCSDVAPAVVRIQCKSGKMVEIHWFFTQMEILFFPASSESFPPDPQKVSITYFDLTAMLLTI